MESEVQQHKQNFIINQADTWRKRQKAISFDVCFIQYYCQLSKSVMEAIFVCVLTSIDTEQHLALWKFLITFTHVWDIVTVY